MMLNNIDACIFDMDGTLIDSMWMWKDIDIEFLGRKNITIPDNLQKQIEGMNFLQTAVYFKEHFGFEESVEEIMHIWNCMAMDKYRYEVFLKDGAEDFLRYLKLHDVKLGIATSNSGKLAMCSLDSLGITDYFDAIITGNDVEKGKPDPEIYLKCAGTLGISPSKCLVFEDILPGIESAHRAGMKVCAVYDDYSADTDDWKRAQSDYYINGFADIERKETWQ